MMEIEVELKLIVMMEAIVFDDDNETNVFDI